MGRHRLRDRLPRLPSAGSSASSFQPVPPDRPEPVARSRSLTLPTNHADPHMTHTDGAPIYRYPPAPPPDPSPSPHETGEGGCASTRWAHLPPVRIGWIANPLREFLGSTGRLHIFGVGGLKRVAAHRAGASLMEAMDWMAARCVVMVYVADGAGAEGSRVYDSVRPVSPLMLGHDAEEDEAEALAYRALDEGRAVVASGSVGGGFARNPACKSFLAAIEEEVQRPLEVLVGGFAHGGSLAPTVDGLLALGHRATVLRDATSFPARKLERRPPPGWAGDGTVASLADLRTSAQVLRQGTFADLELEEAHERMESLARRSPRFSSLHILDETVPWGFYRSRLEAARTRPPDGLALVGDELVNDPIVTWKSIILGAIYELSDDDLEFLVLDRLSFRRFAGLTMTEPPPRAGTLKIHREHWNRTGVMAELVADVDRRWRKEGYRLPGLERLMGSSPAVPGSPEDGGREEGGSRPGPRAVSKVSRRRKRRGRRKRRKRRRK